VNGYTTDTLSFQSQTNIITTTTTTTIIPWCYLTLVALEKGLLNI
jgi:hypothetical protein